MLGFGPLASSPLGATSSGDSINPVMSGLLTVSNITNTSATFSWTLGSDNRGVVAYEVSLDNGATYTGVGDVLTVTETNLLPATLYTVRVRAIDSSGNRSNHLSASFTTDIVLQSVTWSCLLGTISATGLYTAPVAIPTAQTDTITATSVQDPTRKAFATVTINPAIVVVPPAPPPNVDDLINLAIPESAIATYIQLKVDVEY